MATSTEFRDRQYQQAAQTVEDIEGLLQLEFPIQLALATLRQLHGKLFALDGNTCTGHIHWRDGKNPNASNKMMIIHQNGQGCPLHGRSKKPNGRIRVYIGTDPERQAAARQAIAALPQQAQLERDASRCIRLIQRTLTRLRNTREQLDQLQKDLS